MVWWANEQNRRRVLVHQNIVLKAALMLSDIGSVGFKVDNDQSR